MIKALIGSIFILADLVQILVNGFNPITQAVIVFIV